MTPARRAATIAELLAELRHAGVELSLQDGNLRVRAPRGALKPELRERLVSERDAVVAALSGALQSARAVEPIPETSPDLPAPLSRGQRRLWFLDRLNPGSAFLNLPATLRIRGPLDLDALRWVVAEIGRRHDALRTAVVMRDGEPCQVVQPVSLDLEVVDFSALPESQRLAALMERRDEEARRPLPSERAPLIRFFVLRAASDDHYFIFVASHLVFDGWSHDIVFRELSALYEARVRGTSVPPPPELRLADFVRWQLERHSGAGLREEILTLGARLKGMPAALALPVDFTRPTEPSGKGERRALVLDRELVSALRRVALAHGVTLNMLVLASVELLIERFSGQGDFGIGVPSQGRTHPECEGVIGMFVNTLVLRSDVPKAARFADLMARVRDSSLDALAHEDVPFEALVQVLRPARERGRTPLFQVMYSYHEASTRKYRVLDLTLEELPTYSGSSAYDLTFWLLDHGETALAEIETNSDVFSSATNERLRNAWKALLEAVAAAPELPLDSDRFDILEDEEPSAPPRASEVGAGSPAMASPAPHDELERSLIEIWKAALGLGEIGVNDDFFDLGGESLTAVRIFDELRRLHRVELPIGVLFECRTIARLARRLRGDDVPRRGAGLWNTIVPIRSSGPLPPLFCVSGLGGNPLHLRHFAAALGDFQPFYALQHRGVDGRHEPHHSIDAMADEFLADIRGVQSSGPYYLAGYRSAGLAAYQVAWRLRALGEPVGLLVLLDTTNPHSSRRALKQLIQEHLGAIRNPRRLAQRLSGRADQWVTRARSSIGARLANRDPFRFRNDAVLQAGLDAASRFYPEPYDGDVLLLQTAATRGAAGADESRGWRELVRGSLEVVCLECNDADPVGEGAARLAAKRLEHALGATRAKSSVPAAGRESAELR